MLRSGNGQAIAEALVGLAYHWPDWQRVQDICLSLLDHPDSGVRAIAVTCLGHVARIHGELDTARVLPQLRALLQDPDLSGRAEDAIEDIESFTTNPE